MEEAPTPEAPAEADWRPPRGRVDLADGEVHIWRMPLTATDDEATALELLLSQAELARARAFRFARDRQRFVVAHGRLRCVLAAYTGQGPGQIEFRVEPHGKPELVPAAARARGLRFNMSHSHELALCAVTRARMVGVDVERVQAGVDLMPMARRFFSARELAELRALPAEQRPEGFFNCWTRKEAYVKAVGMGMSLALDQFTVSLRPGEPARLLNTPWDAAEPGGWTLCDLRPAAGHVAALAVQGRGCRLVRWSATHSTARPDPADV